MKKIISKIILLIILVFMVICTKSNASSASNDINFSITTDKSIINAGDEINLEFNITNPNIGLVTMVAYLNYDEDIFESISNEDFTINIDEDDLEMFNYDKRLAKVVMTFNDDLKNINKLFTIKLKVKKNPIINNSSTDIFSIEPTESWNMENDILYQYKEEDIVSANFRFATNNELYLKSRQYQIGEEKEQDIDEYKEGDKYIIKVLPNTSITDFINNLDTNADTKEIINKAGNKITDYSKLVGTAMKIKLSKENCKDIELTIIVTGDANGNGVVDMGDLTILRGKLYEQKTLEDTEHKALDINFNKVINMNVLTTIRNVLYEGGSLK